VQSNAYPVPQALRRLKAPRPSNSAPHRARSAFGLQPAVPPALSVKPAFTTTKSDPSALRVAGGARLGHSLTSQACESAHPVMLELTMKTPAQLHQRSALDVKLEHSVPSSDPKRGIIARLARLIRSTTGPVPPACKSASGAPTSCLLRPALIP